MTTKTDAWVTKDGSLFLTKEESDYYEGFQDFKRWYASNASHDSPPAKGLYKFIVEHEDYLAERRLASQANKLDEYFEDCRKKTEDTKIAEIPEGGGILTKSGRDHEADTQWDYSFDGLTSHPQEG